MLTPAAPMPWMARPTRRAPKADVGAPVQIAEPMSRKRMVSWMVVCRPKISAAWAQKGRKAAAVRLKAEMIQFDSD